VPLSISFENLNLTVGKTRIIQDLTGAIYAKSTCALVRTEGRQTHDDTAMVRAAFLDCHHDDGHQHDPCHGPHVTFSGADGPLGCREDEPADAPPGAGALREDRWDDEGEWIALLKVPPTRATGAPVLERASKTLPRRDLADIRPWSNS
jgi:hypothetical protein